MTSVYSVKEFYKLSYKEIPVSDAGDSESDYVDEEYLADDTDESSDGEAEAESAEMSLRSLC